MSSAVPALKPARVQLVIENGSLKGQAFPIRQGRITIGRDNDNDIVVGVDAKMSRKHAEIVIENGVGTVKNLSQKNPMLVDGKEVESAVLQRTSRIQIGSTVFAVRLEAPPVMSPTPHLRVAPAPQAPLQPLAGTRSESPLAAAHSAQSRPSSRVQHPDDAKKMNFYIIVGIVTVAMIWLFSGGSNIGKKMSQLRTRDQVILDLEKSESAVREIEKKQEDTGQQSLQYKTAQEHYIKGFRDYRQGQYARAMSSFQAALSFYPQHELAKKYLTLSRRKFDEIVQFNMIQGKRYKGKNNFRLCKSAYANVMIMVKDPNDAIYREAKQYYNECSLLFEAKY